MQLLGRAGAPPKIAGPEERPFVMFPLATSYVMKTKEEDGSGRFSFSVTVHLCESLTNLN